MIPININTCCFVKGTKITMFDYTTKNIEDVKIGDIVITYNEENKAAEPEKFDTNGNITAAWQNW